ncbi:hypothetical protein A6F65_01301 [Paraurantiacibacter namhicola]|uniref:DUF4276 family protein n=1 Tax=Paraurantiacibacter namhicola TaxID=645517 RepID=A0A1C7D839_9SPHN|nr:hypothetical protein A6F65_01301 [Paraurantiacibacter namhicola]
MFISWASIYEGSTDESYFGALLPRVLNDLILSNANRTVDVADFPAMRFGKSGKHIDEIAEEICDGMEAFDLLFSHADTGGRSLERTAIARSMAYAQAAHARCGYDVMACFPILPRKEMEAWALTDGHAVCRSLGFRGNPSELNLPSTARQAERLSDPKEILRLAIGEVKRRVRPSDAARLLTSIAQTQSIERLRLCASYASFERSLSEHLEEKGYYR